MTTKVLMGLGILFLATVPVAEASGASACGKATAEVLYSASFMWAGNAAGDAASKKIIVARAAKPGFTDSKLIARVMNGSRCEAVCNVQRVETFTEANPGHVAASPALQVASIDMTCKSSALGALAAPATLFLRDEATGRKETILRFGTWLQGYEQASLNTELDRTARLLPAGAPNNSKQPSVLGQKMQQRTPAVELADQR